MYYIFKYVNFDWCVCVCVFSLLDWIWTFWPLRLESYSCFGYYANLCKFVI